MYLKIPHKMHSKIQFFLDECGSLEWSGPAWYKPTYKKGELFPQGFTLMYFEPVDLGHGASTEVNAKHSAKIISQVYKSGKFDGCMQGLIHSHHSMGAFFSGTDKGTIKEMAPQENFFCSLVVATAKSKFAFAVGYRDQYGITHIKKVKEDKVSLIFPQARESKEWLKTYTKIKKRKKPRTYATYINRRGGYGGGHYQYGITGDYDSYFDPKIGSYIDPSQNDGFGTTEMEVIAEHNPELWAQFVALHDQYDKKEIDFNKLKDGCNKIGLDSWIRWHKPDVYKRLTKNGGKNEQTSK